MLIGVLTHLEKCVIEIIALQVYKKKKREKKSEGKIELKHVSFKSKPFKIVACKCTSTYIDI